MKADMSLDLLVKSRLKNWGQRPPGIRPFRSHDTWLRGRPSDDERHIASPFLKIPGSRRLRTLPDGLWLNFGGTHAEPFVDVLAIEACSTLQNLLDKRSRFAPSTHSLMCLCPVQWLLAPIAEDDPTPRWRTTGLILHEPFSDFVLPVREIRVLYGLKGEHYRGFIRYQLPHAHEFFVPMETLTAENSEKDPALQALLARTSVSANFLTP